jgi:hypothetical protein
MMRVMLSFQERDGAVVHSDYVSVSNRTTINQLRSIATDHVRAHPRRGDIRRVSVYKLHFDFIMPLE